MLLWGEETHPKGYHGGNKDRPDRGQFTNERKNGRKGGRKGGRSHFGDHRNGNRHHNKRGNPSYTYQNDKKDNKAGGNPENHPTDHGRGKNSHQHRKNGKNSHQHRKNEGAGAKSVLLSPCSGGVAGFGAVFAFRLRKEERPPIIPP